MKTWPIVWPSGWDAAALQTASFLVMSHQQIIWYSVPYSWRINHYSMITKDLALRSGDSQRNLEVKGIFLIFFAYQ
jgi:hypothetical protein